MPTVDRIIADDLTLLSVESFSQYAAVVAKSVTGSTVTTVHVDSVVGPGYAGVFFAGPLSAGQRPFMAIVTDKDAAVYRMAGLLSDSSQGISVASYTLSPLLGSWNQEFPHYFGLTATNSMVAGTINGIPWPQPVYDEWAAGTGTAYGAAVTGGALRAGEAVGNVLAYDALLQSTAASTGFTLSIAGQILVRPNVSADVSTARLYTCRTFAGSGVSFLPFPSGVTPVTTGLGTQSNWMAPERRLFQGAIFDAYGITGNTTIVSAGSATAYSQALDGVVPGPMPARYALGVAPAFDAMVYIIDPDDDIAALTYSSQPRIHGIVSAYFGDLDFDVGKTVPWARYFVDDMFVADINSGDPRYWVIDWDRTFPESRTRSLGEDYFTNPVAWRKAQFAAADAAWNYGDDDWVLFLDSSEALSCDTRSTPDDVAVNPFRSYMHREVQRCIDNGRTFACLPWYAFVRDDSVPDSRRFYQITDVTLIQDQDQQVAVLPVTDSSNVSVLPVSAPYYHQPSNFTERGLVRLIKVSALRSLSFDWTRLDVLSQPDDGVKVQVISYAYAKWTNPSTGTNDGLKMRQRISQVRPLAGLPSSGVSDVSGDAGPYTVAVNGVLTPVAASTNQTAPLLTPMYSAYFRRNPRDGVWYKRGFSGPEVPDPPYAFSYPPPTGLALANNATVKVN